MHTGASSINSDTWPRLFAYAYARAGAAPTGSDLTQQIVREIAMARGPVDYKICAVDDTWSGLLFRRRGGRSMQSRA